MSRGSEAGCNSTQSHFAIKRSESRRLFNRRGEQAFQRIRAKENFACQVLNRICTIRPQVFHTSVTGVWADAGKMLHRLNMQLSIRCVAVLMACALAASRADAADGATLFRVFLTDGSSLVTYGEFARTADEVVLSLPIGGTPQAPRLHAVTLAASRVDWEKTNRDVASTRYQRYVATRAEADYQLLTEEVAGVLSNIAQSTDRAKALATAERARRTLTEWPQSHYGYRQQDIQEIVRVLDSAIARLQGGAPPPPFQIALVSAPEMTLEPLAAMPSPREQLEQLLRLARLTNNVSDRFALLQSALTLLAAPGVTGSEATKLRRLVEDQIDREVTIDQRYGRVTRDLLTRATRAAENAQIRDVERVLERIPKEDVRLGSQRPEIVQALTTSVQSQLANARQLRLLRDQWKSRQAVFREYQRSVGMDLVQLVKARTSLESIKKLDGPAPDRLDTLNRVLSGGATRLDRLLVPEYLRSTHELVIGAWRFAEAAAAARLRAVTSGEISVAWEASSAAAGALMMLSRAQKELRTLIEPPKLQ
jgi:hypothetical protein